MPKTKSKLLTSATTTADDPARDARPLQFSSPPFWPAQLSIKHTAEYLDYSVPRVWELIKERELDTVAEKAGSKRWVIMASIERYRAKLHQAADDAAAEYSRSAKASAVHPEA
jgi:hypothetical protein